MAERPEQTRKDGGGTAGDRGFACQTDTAWEDQTGEWAKVTMEEVLRPDNVREALRRVVSNKGAPGIDGMTVEELRPFLRENWRELRQMLLEGNYYPQPVLRVDIPKPGGKGMRMLGIPTVIDRFIQQSFFRSFKGTTTQLSRIGAMASVRKEVLIKHYGKPANI